MGAAIAARLIDEGYYVVGIEADERSRYDLNQTGGRGEHRLEMQLNSCAQEVALRAKPCPLAGWVNNAAVQFQDTSRRSHGRRRSRTRKPSVSSTVRRRWRLPRAECGWNDS
jgi:hypothetical protein